MLIDKQDAIEAAKDLLRYHGKDLTEELINYFSTNAMERIPSAQPENSECWGCNCPKMEGLEAQPEDKCSECDAWNKYKNYPSAQPEDWMERNKERILRAGMEGREIEFRIGGRQFAIREKAQ